MNLPIQPFREQRDIVVLLKCYLYPPAFKSSNSSLNYVSEHKTWSTETLSTFIEWLVRSKIRLDRFQLLPWNRSFFSVIALRRSKLSFLHKFLLEWGWLRYWFRYAVSIRYLMHSFQLKLTYWFENLDLKKVYLNTLK